MSCQDVCLVMDGDGYSEFSRESKPRARKQYRCCECNAVIAIGEQHQYLTGKYDGHLWSERTCLVCMEIRAAYTCEGYMIAELWESIAEQMFPDWNEMVAIDCLAKLTTQPAIDVMRAAYAQWLVDGTIYRAPKPASDATTRESASL